MFLNAGYTVVGKVAGPVQLGFFLLAFNISNWAPGIITTAIRYVSVAGFARLSETDDGLAVGMRRSLLLLIGVVTPIAVLMGILADPLIGGLYGERWLAAAAVLRFLMVFMTVRMIMALVTEALMGAGTIRVTVWMNGLCALALIPAVLFGAQRYGIAGAAASHARRECGRGPAPGLARRSTASASTCDPSCPRCDGCRWPARRPAS